MKKADKIIVDANPGATPQALLTKGLSEDGYLELLSQSSEKTAKVLNASPLPHIPIVGTLIQPIVTNVGGSISSGKVRIMPIGGGSGTIMDKDRANKMAQRSPNTYITRPV